MTIFATIRALANIAHKYGNVQVQVKMGNSTYLPAAPKVSEYQGEKFIEMDIDEDYVKRTEFNTIGLEERILSDELQGGAEMEH